MKPQLLRFGTQRSPVVVIDEFSGDIARLVEIAAALAPFPAVADTYYPGVRRTITKDDSAANDYVERALEAAAPFIGGAFDINAFTLIDASFSMVTTAPGALTPAQRAPHFDSAKGDQIALLHYLRVTEGTAFYRQRATGIELVNAENVDAFVAAARAETDLRRHAGYIADSDEAYEQIGRVDGVVDRLVMYSGSLLHSGIIRPSANLSADPRRGRLTANFFVRIT